MKPIDIAVEDWGRVELHPELAHVEVVDSRDQCDQGTDIHLDRHGGRNSVLLDGVHCCGRSLDNINECRCLGHIGRGCPLLLHARVLGATPHVPNPLPLHRLDDHRPIAND